MNQTVTGAQAPVEPLHFEPQQEVRAKNQVTAALRGPGCPPHNTAPVVNRNNPPPCGGAIDSADALRFLALLGKDPETARFRFFPHKRNPQAATIRARKEVGFNPDAIARHQAAGCGAYLVIGDGGDTDATIVSIGALFVEWDDKPISWQRDAWRELGLPEPSLQVETGGASIHNYWRLAEPLPPDQWRAAMLRLIAHCGSDPKIKNPSRVMRLPGCAYIGADGQPSGQTRIIHATGASYSLGEILGHTTELPAPPAAAEPAAPRTTTTPARIVLHCSGQSRPLEQIREALATIPPILPDTGQRDTFRALAWGLLQAVREAGGDDATAAALLQAHSPAVTDALQYLRTDPHSIGAGSFWYLARQAGWRPEAERTTAAAVGSAAPAGPAAAAVLPNLRAAAVTTPAGVRLHDAAPLPGADEARLLALPGAMGTGKTYAIGQLLGPYLAEGVPVLNLTHRVSLGQAQSEAWGLPWAPEPGSDERLQGAGLCWDSCCPSSAVRIRPSEWSGADGHGPVVVLDEWAQGVEHLLFGHGTAIANRRPAVLEAAGELLQSARQVICSDAQLSEAVLQLAEALTGETARVIGSAHQPMAGRRLICPQGLTAAEASEQGRGKVLELIEAGRPFLCWSSSQTAGSPNSPQNLARLHRQRKPEARLLVIDSENPEAAERLAASPDTVAAGVDAIYCSPSIASGLSIDLRDHFAAVVVLGGGTVGPENLAQAAARVRDPGCPVFVFCPKQAPGRHLKVGSGDTKPAGLLRHLARCEAQLLADLTAAGGWEPMERNESAWLRCWLELACLKNRQRLAYAATVAGLLQREGWLLEAAAAPSREALAQAEAASEQLGKIARDAQAAEDAAVIDAEPLTQAEARELERKRRHTPEERAQLQRYRVAQRWGLKSAAPTVPLLEADRDGLSSRARFGWILRSIEARQLAARHDRRRRDQLAPNGQAWGPDLLRELLGHRIAAADGLGLPAWLERADGGEWFTAQDPQLRALQALLCEQQAPEDGETLEQEAQRRAENHRRRDRAAWIAAALGVSPGKRATTTLRGLLAAAGHQLEAKRIRGGDGQKWRYRVRPAPLPEGADPAQLLEAWRDQLGNAGG